MGTTGPGSAPRAYTGTGGGTIGANAAVGTMCNLAGSGDDGPFGGNSNSKGEWRSSKRTWLRLRRSCKR
eukprot:1971686-Prorocentrum_lima.AAC.1